MLPEYRTIYQGGEDEIVEKNSRFIASVIPVENEEEALEFIEKTKLLLTKTDYNVSFFLYRMLKQIQPVLLGLFQ